MTALSDLENLRLHDVDDGDVRDDPRWRALVGEDPDKAFLAQMAAKHLDEQVKRFDPNQLRDPHTGEWIDTTPGDGGKNPLDKLGLAKRIDLKPGEKLLSSRKIRTDGQTWDLLAAEVDTPTGRQVRLGIVAPDESKRWAAGPDQKRARRIAELSERIQRIDNGEEEADDDAYEQLLEERSELGDPDEDWSRTATLTPATVAQMRTGLELGAERGRAHQKEWDRFWASTEGQRLDELVDIQSQALAPFRNTPSILRTDDDKRRMAEIQARFEAEHGDEFRRLDALSPDSEAVFAEGHLPGGPEGDLHYEVAGSDDGEGGWRVRLGIKPPDAGDEWSIGFGDDEVAFAGSDVKRLIKELGELSGDKPKSSSTPDLQGKHLPGRHDQSSQGAEAEDSETEEGRGMAFKSFNPAIKAVDDSGEGTATFRIASYNEVDKDGDVTVPGFFGKQHVTMVPVHDWNHVPIGKGQIYEESDGAYCDVKFNLAIPEAKAWYEAIKFDMANPPALQQYSYGFEILPGGSKSGQHSGRQVRYLTPMADGTPGVKVFEVSPVLQGAGTGTRTVSVKGRSMRSNRAAVGETPASRAVKGAIPAHETKTVSRAWDRGRTENALPDDARPSELRTVYAWVDPDGDPELKGSYRFAHHHGIGGPANLRAALMGIAALNGPDGQDMPEAERKGIYDHLAAHLKDADRDIPDLRTGPGDSKNRRFHDEAAEVLASVGALIDRASEVMAMRRTKGRAMAASTSDLLGWVSDELVRLKHLLSNPVEPEAPQPDDDEIASVVAASIARLNGI